MQLHGLIHTFPKEIKLFIGAFVIVLSVGYFTGLLFVGQTSTTAPHGIEENYLGNEENEEAEVMKFKKGAREMLTIIHTHILSMSFIFFLLGGLLAITSVPKKIKTFLMLEPFLSILLTFGGIYFLWTGILWMKYVVMLSGIFMTASYTVGAFFVFRQLFKK
ncbi:hypothetical protein GCM10022393_02260 [Aquimarina addita]|uniref:Uncharacterized protein n=1 Tax=Aquimarina addita TaxID=870485 RepID=A0ABP7X8M7_9FLAO